jgi:hypothetical protein
MAKTIEKIPSKLDPGIVKELGLIKKKASELPLIIKTDEEQARIGALQNAVHSLIKSIEAWYDRHTKPINDALKALRAEKKNLLAEPEDWNDKASHLLADYFYRKQEATEKERLALQRKLDAEAEAARKREIKALKTSGDKEGALALAAAPVVAPIAEVENTASLDGKSFRDDLDVTILDLAAVPLEYIKLELRLQAVKDAYKSGVRDIPGLILKPIKTLVNRG